MDDDTIKALEDSLYEITEDSATTSQAGAIKTQHVKKALSKDDIDKSIIVKSYKLRADMPDDINAFQDPEKTRYYPMPFEFKTGKIIGVKFTNEWIKNTQSTITNNIWSIRGDEDLLIEVQNDTDSKKYIYAVCSSTVEILAPAISTQQKVPYTYSQQSTKQNENTFLHKFVLYTAIFISALSLTFSIGAFLRLKGLEQRIVSIGK